MKWLMLATVLAVGCCQETAYDRNIKAGMKTPQTSKLFVKFTDPKTGIVSYLLKPGSFAFNQQSLYFTAKSMTEDGRFLVFDYSDDEFKRNAKGKRISVTKRKAIIDFMKDEIIPLEDTTGTIPFIDTVADQMWYMDDNGLHRRDFLVDPKKDNIVCAVPPELIRKTKGKTRFATHITLSPDRKQAFLDVSLDGREIEGVLNIETGKWTQWWEAYYDCNHGQFNPVDPTMAMCAWERARNKVRAEMTPEEIATATFKGYVSDKLRASDDVYPRLWLFRKGEAREVTSKITGYATHEYFAEDGKGFYWCTGGVSYHDLATGREWRINPLGSAHASMDASNRYIASDCSWGGWWRGCGWTTLFWNRETHCGVYIHSKTPRLVSKEDQSKLHPDPHPQIVCGARYVITTMNDQDRHMNLSVTPMDQLIAYTTDKKNMPTPKTFKVDWDPSTRTDATYEMGINVAALREKKMVAEPPCAVYSDTYTAFAIRGIVNGKEQAIAAEAVQGLDFHNDIVMRFKIPAATTELFCVVDAPGKFEYYDSESCANMMWNAYQPENAAKWVMTNGARTDKHRAGLVIEGQGAASYEVEVPADAVGKPVRFELNMRNLGVSDWTGDVTIAQLDANGNVLAADALNGQGKNGSIKPDTRHEYRFNGKLDAAARKVRLVISLKSVDGKASKVLVHRLNLREGTFFPFSIKK